MATVQGSSGDPTPPPPSPTPAPAPTPAPVVSSLWKAIVAKNWQGVVGWMAVAAVTTLLNHFFFKTDPLPSPEPPTPIFQGSFGWHEPTETDVKAALAAPNVYKFDETEAGQADAVGDADGNAFLWNIVAKGFGGQIPTLDQGGVGSCVGNGWAQGINYVIAIQAALNRGPPIDGKVVIPAEVVYGGSRVNANGGRAPLMGDGSNGSWAARFVTEIGVCQRGVYGPYDVTKYSESACRTLGRAGIKGELLDACKKNVVSAALVNSADDIKKALLQGYTVPICSDVGFAGQSSRDADGFLKARGMWPHCMLVCGYRKDKDAFYILNSWGDNWVSGPLGPGNPPPGGFWISRSDMERIARQGDSYAVSAVKGFPRKKLNADDWIAVRPVDKADKWNLNFGGMLYASSP